jgi:phosphatidylethanolamine/phosphatidyl-N-methylethanolamine N-methyltransferase
MRGGLRAEVHGSRLNMSGWSQPCRARIVMSTEADREATVTIGTYERLAAVYDVVFGAVLQSGRKRAVDCLGLRPGHRVLEVGVGTGLNAELYPGDCAVTGIDLSRAMLERARQRVERKGLRHIQLLEMDAAHLTFPDGTFDTVYAPYLVSAVPDPVAVAREMRRVCRPGGRIVILNHFRSTNAWLATVERAITAVTAHVGFMADVDLVSLLAKADLTARSVEKVNMPKMWSLVTCVNEVGSFRES